MNNKFNDNFYLVTEATGLLKAGNTYFVYDSKGNKIGYLQEELHGIFKKMLKFTPLKTLLSFKINF